ncbi:MAG: BMP family ABC transporter substrate-binding protein [Elusimicrobiales bacterium]|nr:BMP family ABC transporter substrate-binding protein [Elusimicrobiales bacterium]
MPSKYTGLLFFAALCAAGLCGCARKQAAESGAKKIGLVFDVGGRGDKSFNDSAYNGMERARKELGIEYSYIEPGEGADKESALRQLASGREGLIFGTGFLFTDDINIVSADFPDKMFACVDYAVNPAKPIAPNVVALKFREQEGSFLVGAIAGLTTKTNVVGFVGGMDIPLIHKFELGYAAGVKAVNPQCKVIVGYAGVTGEAFKNPAKGKAIAFSQIDQGADIIFHASGSTGLGVFEAARERNIKAIGVDSDQYSEAPGYILTSMIKKVDVGLYETVKSWLAGTLKGGVTELGLARDGVGYVYDENNKDLISPETIKKVESLKRKIISGEIKVPSVKENR